MALRLYGTSRRTAVGSQSNEEGPKPFYSGGTLYVGYRLKLRVCRPDACAIDYYAETFLVRRAEGALCENERRSCGTQLTQHGRGCH